ncbi:hypothetical protein GM921_09775 [Pedobacter sp. LMG 31464]|uniref:Type II secretion system (T2SS), protein M subtype b n=1 Tax=Pedobacter planticolens TaxID=2679964 RepID=A0A923E026_9SPHI|nr:hypothetical protein [Pedobacter planticolens]MBB2145775.1 hypothetical protein [Pedobacter planticolens]
MWQKLSDKQRKLVLIVAMLIVAYIAFRCSFVPALKAVQLNRELQQVQGGHKVSGSSFVQLNAEHEFYLRALKGYKVKKEDRENRLWQTVSGMALANDLQISFDPDLKVPTDTSAVSNGVVAQQFKFKGSYVNLVKLLDTLSKSSGIGKISQVKLSVKIENEVSMATNSLTLQVTLVAIVQ